MIDVALECGGAGNAAPTLVLQQSRLKPAGSTIESKGAWNTPACFGFSLNGKVEKQCVNVPNGTTRVALNNVKSCPDWLMGNAQGVGYYVTRYDKSLGARLKQQASNLPAPEAISMLSDARLMTQSGLQSIDESLEQVAGQIGHRDVVVQQSALGLLNSLRVEWFNPVQRQAYAQLMRDQVVPMATRLTWLDQPGDNERVRRLRETALPLAADRGEAIALRNQATAFASAWLAKREAIPAGMVDAVLGTAGQFAEPALFAAMEQELLKSEDGGDRQKLLSALAQVRAPDLRERALALALHDKVNGREAQNFLETALDEDHNRAASFAFLQKHFNALAVKVPQHRVAQFMQGLERMCSSGEREDFVDFFKSRHAKYEGGPLIYTQSLEKIELCIAARASNESQVKQAGVE